jgi:hypothetical protein
MASTRFNSDPCRISKKLQQMTDQGRYIMNTPGNGESPCFIEDPQIILQGWGANLRTNSINLESELFGVNRKSSRDCLGKDEYQKFNFNSSAINYPTCKNLFTEQSRAIMPAWTARDLEQVDWYTLPLNPQENTCMSFENNLSTRILEKDYFVSKIPCNLSNDRNYSLPVIPIKGSYVGGPNTCMTNNSCKQI